MSDMSRAVFFKATSYAVTGRRLYSQNAVLFLEKHCSGTKRELLSDIAWYRAGTSGEAVHWDSGYERYDRGRDAVLVLAAEEFGLGHSEGYEDKSVTETVRWMVWAGLRH